MMASVSGSNSDPEIVLDLSRLISRITHATPTGVDRCEMAYARGLLAAAPDRLSFAAVHPTGFYGRLPKDPVLRFLDLTEERWASRGFSSIWDKRRFVVGALAALRPRLPLQPPNRTARVYVQASPNNLTRPRLIKRILDYERARFVCLVHDLIPLEYPEYARADGAAKHIIRIRSLTQHASGILTNSHATLGSLKPWLDRYGSVAETAVAHLGVEQVAPSTAVAEAIEERRPYFVCIGTIEPRKNHLLLLHLWRQMSERRGAAEIPRLLVIGRRGWENEQIIDMLERCPALVGCVGEMNGLSDGQVQAKLRGAQALLIPSFAEGYGMPVIEALQAGVPVICSDLPALREAGGGVPEFLDPLDGPAWLDAIDRYTTPDGRADQLERLKHWRAPTWQEHIAILLKMVHGLP